MGTSSTFGPITLELVGREDIINVTIQPDQLDDELRECLRRRDLLTRTGTCDCGAAFSLHDAEVIGVTRQVKRHMGQPVTPIAVPHVHFPDCPGHHRNLLHLLKRNGCEVYLVSPMFPGRRFPL